MYRYIFIFSIIIIAVITRLVPHPPNFTPICAIALFVGSTLPKRMSFIVPISIMLISDYFIGFHSLIPVVYGCLLFNVFLGYVIGRKYIIITTLTSSIIFFITTNFAVWVLHSEHSLTTLIECYVIAIPFFKYSVIGDLFYSSMLFGSLTLAENKFENVRINYQSLREIT